MKNDEVNSKVVANNTVTVENTRNIQVETVVYRLQIGISTMRMTDKEITEFKNAGKSVLTIDHGGWFSYNIGEFNSMQEAQKFKANARLVDATVVKFVNGKLIEE